MRKSTFYNYYFDFLKFWVFITPYSNSLELPFVFGTYDLPMLDQFCGNAVFYYYYFN